MNRTAGALGSTSISVIAEQERLGRWQSPIACAGIVLAAVAAHGGCLRATFYLDDWWQLVESDSVLWHSWYLERLRSLTYLSHRLVYLCAGMSSPAFHAANLGFHALTAVCLFFFGRDYLRAAAGMAEARARRVGCWAGLLFAVHPLCSEIPNYARARDIELVSLFSLLAGWATLRWRWLGLLWWRGGLPCLAAVLGATYSKEVGIVLSLASVVLVALVVVPAGEHAGAAGITGEGRSTFRSIAAAVWRLAPGTGTMKAMFLAVTVPVMGVAVGWVALSRLEASRIFSDPRFGWHAVTQARIFWMYLRRVALPMGLCSDHYIAWTHAWGDGVAWVSVAALGGIIGVTAWPLWKHWRAVSVLLSLSLLGILHRLAYPSNELMVEYRMYPAMMFLCVLLAWGIDTGLRGAATPVDPTSWRARLGSPVFQWTLILLLISVGIVLSERRSRDWRTLEALSANVVAQYLFNGRAIQEVQEEDLRAKRWQDALSRQAAIRIALRGAEQYNLSHPDRAYAPSSLTLVHVCSEGNYGEALAELGRRREAIAHMDWLEQMMQANHVENAALQANYHYSRGRVYEASGRLPEAARDLRRAIEEAPYFPFIRKALSRVEAELPPSSEEAGSQSKE